MASKHCTGSLLFLGAGPEDRSFPRHGSGFLGVPRSKLGPWRPRRGGEWLGGFAPHAPLPRLTFLWVPQLGKVYGIESHVLSPGETKALYPLMNVEDLYGTLYVPHDGTMDPAGTCTSLARAASARGAQVRPSPGPGSPAPSPPLLPGNTSSLCAETMGQPEPKSLTRSCPDLLAASGLSMMSTLPAGIANLPQISPCYFLSSFVSSPHVVVGKIRKGK